MIRQLLSFTFVWLVSGVLYATPAYPRKIAFTLPDGTVTHITLKGDEHNKWALTEDGYTVLPGKDGWYYAMADSTQRAVRSVHRLCDIKDRSERLRQFLDSQPRAMLPAFTTTQPHKAGRPITRVHRQSVVGDRRALVILMAFSDKTFNRTQTEFDALFNQPQYRVDGACGSVNDYFREVSYGQLNLTADVFGPYVAQHTMAYYGRNDMSGNDYNPQALFREALSRVAEETDLSDYDADGDGYVDNVHIIFAGYGEEAGGPSDAIWSHEATFPEIAVQRVRVDRYSCTPELRGNRGTGISRIGPCCHEIGHALGAMDYYDTDYGTGGQFSGTGQWDIMAEGSWNNEGITPAHFNPYVKAYDFGWVEATELKGNGVLEIPPTGTGQGEVFRINTSSSADYYLMEHRIRSGFDTGLPGEGLLIYHVHPDIGQALSANTANASAPQKLYPVCASSTVRTPSAQPATYGKINSDGCPFPGSGGVTVFGPSTVPAAFCWDGSEAGFELSDIGLTPEGNIRLDYRTQDDDPLLPAETVWRESFEDVASADTWQAHVACSGLSWAIYEARTNLGGLQSWDKITDAADGTHYIGLKRTLLNDKESGVIVSPFTTDATGGKAVLHFSYQLRGRTLKPDIALAIICSDKSKPEVWDTLWRATAIQGEWLEASVPLPSRSQGLAIGFYARLESYSGAFVDNVSVTRPTVQTTVVPLPAPSPSVRVEQGRLHIKLPTAARITVCRPNGTVVYARKQQEGNHQFHLPAGIYIVAIDGKNTKVAVP